MRAINAREFNHDTGRAKREALAEPALILDRGRPSHVLMSITHYRALADGGRSIADLLGMPVIEDIPLELPQKRGAPPRQVEF